MKPMSHASQICIIHLCKDPNVVSAHLDQSDPKYTYISINAYDSEYDEDYGYDGRLAHCRVPANIITAVKALVARLNAAA